jgi:hypothetical protein
LEDFSAEIDMQSQQDRLERVTSSLGRKLRCRAKKRKRLEISKWDFGTGAANRGFFEAYQDNSRAKGKNPATATCDRIRIPDTEDSGGLQAWEC